MNKLETIDSESWLLLFSDTENERWCNHKYVNCTYLGIKMAEKEIENWDGNHMRVVTWYF